MRNAARVGVSALCCAAILVAGLLIAPSVVPTGQGLLAAWWGMAVGLAAFFVGLYLLCNFESLRFRWKTRKVLRTKIEPDLSKQFEEQERFVESVKNDHDWHYYQREHRSERGARYSRVSFYRQCKNCRTNEHLGTRKGCHGGTPTPPLWEPEPSPELQGFLSRRG